MAVYVGHRVTVVWSIHYEDQTKFEELHLFKVLLKVFWTDHCWCWPKDFLKYFPIWDHWLISELENERRNVSWMNVIKRAAVFRASPPWSSAWPPSPWPRLGWGTGCCRLVSWSSDSVSSSQVGRAVGGWVSAWTSQANLKFLLFLSASPRQVEPIGLAAWNTQIVRHKTFLPKKMNIYFFSSRGQSTAKICLYCSDVEVQICHFPQLRGKQSFLIWKKTFLSIDTFQMREGVRRGNLRKWNTNTYKSSGIHFSWTCRLPFPSFLMLIILLWNSIESVLMLKVS